MASTADNARVNHALTVVGIVLCVVLAPILIVNCVLIAKSLIDPDGVPGIGGVTPLVVLSDSMYPEIQKGDLIVMDEADPASLQVGDVIAFYDPSASGDVLVVAHRIIEVTEQDGQRAFVTQGDANDSADLHPTLSENVIGKYGMRFAGVGDVAMFMQTTPGLVVSVGIPILLLVGYDIIRTRLYDRRRREAENELMAELESLRTAKSEGDAS